MTITTTTRLCTMASLLTVVAFSAGCYDIEPVQKQDIQSLKVVLDPAVRVGSEADPSADRSLRFRLEVRDRRGNLATGFNGTVHAYLFFLGTLTPSTRSGSSLLPIRIDNGVATGLTLDLPTAYGPSSLWIEDQGEPDRPATYAAGGTPVLWYRDPYLSDVQAPATPPGPRATPGNFRSALENKQIFVHTSRYGADGRLVVTGTSSQAFNVSDVQCGPGGTPPCRAGDSGHLYVFTFSKPSRSVQVGSVLANVSGGISEFNGFTELNFPRQTVQTDASGNPIIRPELVPAPILLSATGSPSMINNQAMMETVESALVEIRNVKVCPPAPGADLDRWLKYGEFDVADVNGSCAGFDVIGVSVRPMSAFDPTLPANDGLVFSRVVGVVRNVAGLSASTGNAYSFWSITIRDQNDLECAASGCKGM